MVRGVTRKISRIVRGSVVNVVLFLRLTPPKLDYNECLERQAGCGVSSIRCQEPSRVRLVAWRDQKHIAYRIRIGIECCFARLGTDVLSTPRSATASRRNRPHRGQKLSHERPDRGLIRWPFAAGFNSEFRTAKFKRISHRRAHPWIG